VCSPEAISAFSVNATNKVNDLLASLQKKYHLFNFTDQTTGFIRNFTTLEVLLVETDASMSDWMTSLHPLYVITLVFICLFLLAFFVVPNTYLLTKRAKNLPAAIPSKVEWTYQASIMYKPKQKSRDNQDT
jgi:hypothetical protein